MSEYIKELTEKEQEHRMFGKIVPKGTFSLLLKVFFILLIPLSLISTEVFFYDQKDRLESTQATRPFIREFLNFTEIENSVIKFGRVELNHHFLKSDGFRAGQVIYLDMPDGERLTAFVEKFAEDINQTLTLRAKIEGSEFGYALISQSNGRYLGRINIPERREYYQLISSQGRESYLVKVDRTKHRHTNKHGPIIPPPGKGLEISGSSGAVRAKSRKAAGPDGLAIIDLMIVYTPLSSSWADAYSGGINNVIAQAMHLAQLTLDNSDTSIVLRLVLSRQVNHTESPRGAVELYRIRSSPENPGPQNYEGYQINGYMDEIHLWRDQFGADLVAYFPHVSDCEGMAFLLNEPDGRPDYSFSLTNISVAASSYTHIHEVGHNLGAHHHYYQNFQPGPGIFHYSSGWRWTGYDENNYCSVMTYEPGYFFPDNIDHVRVPLFSNPEILHHDVEAGHPFYGDNARTLRETKHVVASYRGMNEQYSPIVRNYPNPFNEKTTISFLAADQGNVKIEMFNIKGQLIKTLLNQDMSMGMHKVTWDGRNNKGRIVPSGLYLYRVISRGNTINRKMMILK